MRHKILTIMSLLLVILSSCSKDGDIVTTGKGDALTLDGVGNLVLDKNIPDGLALTLFWNESQELSTNYKDVLLPNHALHNILEISGTEDFKNKQTFNIPVTSYHKQFTNKDLNTALYKLGFTPDKQQDMYVRVGATTGDNITPQYSNIMSFLVTPYDMDYSIAQVLKQDKSLSGNLLFSPAKDGVYRGFLTMGKYENWWLKECDGTLWGNDNDGTNGTAYAITNESRAWNFWTSELSGLRYVTVDTKQWQWYEVCIPSITVSGGVNGEMTYKKSTNQWILSFNAATTAPVSVSLSCNDAVLYDKNTGTEGGKNTKAVITPDGLSTDGAAGDFTITPQKAGDNTIVIDFTKQQTADLCTVVEGIIEPDKDDKPNPVLCIMGNDDKWDHDEWLSLVDEENKTYTGAVYMNSSWGFYFTKTTDSSDWTKINQDPDSTDKKLKEGGNDIEAPGVGLYVLSASLGWMSYWYEMEDPITSVAYTGLNEDWNLNSMTATETPGVYTATVTVTKDSPWGVQIVLNSNWDYWFGTKADGSLMWKNKDNANPKGISGNGTYTLTVDLCHGTYSLSKN
ncbi:MAG: DUF5114 domain-containing protein [Prevotella sp.]|nr:DUF5114 domain-containing protein [Candidatus Prevotella equi]